tara:strand:+ start:347 stop:523 length:177 start_codon:yes stop_codon:yes gene_type:complete
MAINFPDSPNVDDVFTSGDRQCKVSSTIAGNDTDSWEIFSDASNSVQAKLTWSAWWIR